MNRLLYCHGVCIDYEFEIRRHLKIIRHPGRSFRPEIRAWAEAGYNRFFVESHTCTFLFVNIPLFLLLFTNGLPLCFAGLCGKAHTAAWRWRSKRAVDPPARRNHVRGSELFPDISAPRRSR